MVAAGETGGVLDLILSRVADFMEKAQKLKSRVKGAMVYPIVVSQRRFCDPVDADDVRHSEVRDVF